MNSPTPLQTGLEGYKETLSSLDPSNKPFEKERALEILAARDALQKELEAAAEIPIDMWAKLIEQDARLKQKAYKITQVLDLAEYRETLPISEKAWWWSLESRESLHPYNRFDWLVKTGKILLLGVNFTLIGTLATRFLSGSSGLVEIGGVIFSTFISIVQTQNVLMQVRQKGFAKLMNFLKVREYWYETVQLFTTVIVFGVLLGVWTHLSFFSELYNHQGKQLQSPLESQELPHLALAEKKYLKAIELDEDNLDAHYKLATLYEELQDFDSAKKQYLIAAKGGYLDGYNNLAYWYIRENKDAEAVKLLEEAKNLLAEQDKKIEQLTQAEKLYLQVQKHSIYKNLGWARFRQNRNEDAVPNLKIAIGIAENPDYQKNIRSPGSAYCIYAQVLQKQYKKSSQAKQSWKQCRRLIESHVAAGNEINSEEDKWLYEAKKQLL
jgi:tetratricopeptide (TPR) repeat protein